MLRRVVRGYFLYLGILTIVAILVPIIGTSVPPVVLFLYSTLSFFLFLKPYLDLILHLTSLVNLYLPACNIIRQLIFKLFSSFYSISVHALSRASPSRQTLLPLILTTTAVWVDERTYLAVWRPLPSIFRTTPFSTEKPDPHPTVGYFGCRPFWALFPSVITWAVTNWRPDVGPCLV